MAQKWQIEKDAQEAFAALMALPVENPERPKLRELIPFKPEKLAAKTRKFLSLSPEFQRPNPLPAWRRDPPKAPVYPTWTNGTRQSEPLPFESGRSTLPGMESFLDRAESFE